MGVMLQRQTEMANILDSVYCLGLATQHCFIDHGFVVAVTHMVEDAVEMVWAQDLSARQLCANSLCQVTQPFGFFGVRHVMHTKDTRPAGLDQRFGSCDICRDHEIFNQAL